MFYLFANFHNKRFTYKLALELLGLKGETESPDSLPPIIKKKVSGLFTC